IFFQNPGKFTLQGTNTYILGTEAPYVLLDAAEGRAEYPGTLSSALDILSAPASTDLPEVSDIIISHWHFDHIGGWQCIPRPTRKQLFRSSSPVIRVLHTPGHTIDSISLEIVDDRALYTADSVLGQGTTVFEDLGLYLESLNKMLKYSEEDPNSCQTLYPGHGPVVKNGRELISTYIKHRLEREEQILEVLHRKPNEGDNWTTWTIVKVIYASYPENLWLPAARGIELHLVKLEKENLVKRLGGEGVETGWKLVSRTPSPSL
ncbi:Beta-lactamase-like protein 2, partial [Leucoagaricus sp. SymC.cos]